MRALFRLLLNIHQDISLGYVFEQEVDLAGSASRFVVTVRVDLDVLPQIFYRGVVACYRGDQVIIGLLKSEEALRELIGLDTAEFQLIDNPGNITGRPLAADDSINNSILYLLDHTQMTVALELAGSGLVLIHQSHVDGIGCNIVVPLTLFFQDHNERPSYLRLIDLELLRGFALTVKVIGLKDSLLLLETNNFSACQQDKQQQGDLTYHDSLIKQYLKIAKALFRILVDATLLIRFNAEQYKSICDLSVNKIKDMNKQTKEEGKAPWRLFKANSLEDVMQEQEQKMFQLERNRQQPDDDLSMDNFESLIVDPQKVTTSTPEVDVVNMTKQSGLHLTNDQYQFLNQLFKSGPTKTLAALGIRRSHSYEKEKYQFSLSGDCDDPESQREAMRRKIVKLINDIQQLTEVQIQAKSELLIYKKKNQQCEEHNKKLTEQINCLITEVNQYEQILKQRNQQIVELEHMLLRNKEKDSIIKQCERCERYQNMMKLMRNDFQNHLQQAQLQHQTQIKALNAQFQSARAIGQSQINQLTQELHKKAQELAQLHRRVNQPQFDKQSAIVQQSLSASRNNCRRGEQQQKRISYIERFYQFSQAIDTRLCNSSEKRNSFPVTTTHSNLTIRQPQSPDQVKSKRPFQLQLIS